MTSKSDANATPISVVIVDDHKMIVESIQIVLDGHPSIQVVGVASAVEHGIEIVRQTTPDVVLLDFQIGPDNALDALQRIVDATSTAVIIFTAHKPDDVLVDCLRAGARGFVSKEQTISDVIAAILAVHSGGVAVAPDILMSAMNAASAADSDVHVLSVREFGVLGLVAVGHSNQEIADQLFLSVNTVRNHVAAILAKLDARSRVEAAALFHQGKVAQQGVERRRSGRPPAPPSS